MRSLISPKLKKILQDKEATIELYGSLIDKTDKQVTKQALASNIQHSSRGEKEKSYIDIAAQILLLGLFPGICFSIFYLKGIKET